MQHTPIKIALAQMNCIVGDLAGNVQKIVEQAKNAYLQGAKLLITPELSITGYPPEDLLFRDAFIQANDKALQQLCKELAELKDLHVIVGHPHRGETEETKHLLFNQASVLKNGTVIASYHKHMLPNNEVFDEVRYFAAGNEACVFEIEGLKFGVLICEDVWHAGPAQKAKAAGAQILVIPNASPFHMEKLSLRSEVTRQQVLATGLPAVYVNLVGGQDELVFDGASFALNRDGQTVYNAPQFKEDLGIIQIINGEPQKLPLAKPYSDLQQVYEALVLGVKDYLGKNGFPGAIIGLSGGVDSALVLAIAVDALGADKVRAVMMPSKYTAEISWIDAKEMADQLAVQYDEISILPMMESYDGALKDEFAGLPLDATEENIQARIRGTLLMALSNKSGRIVLTTGNKSEMAVGYCTLYGDMAGGFAVIKDVSKTLVYQLCHYRNTVSAVIPERIITRPPSAELRPDQKDQDSLPSYDILDGIVEHYMENDIPIESLPALGYKKEDVEFVTRLIKINEYKRRQSPVGVRITRRAFGRDWRYPITSKYRG